MTKGYLTFALAGVFMLTSGSAALAAGDLGEFGNNCAYGLTQGVKKFTDCSVQEMIGDKRYCFSKQSAKEEFMKDPEGNIARAEEAFSSQ